MARVVSINLSRAKGTVKTPSKKGLFIKGFGLEGDAHGGNWHRQVSLLADESIEAMRNRGMDLNPGVFAENITTEGIVVHELPVGTRLRIGASVHEVTQIGKDCHKACEIKTIVGDCVMPREGIFTIVIESGKVYIGDPIEIL
jgi:MOSC domain-containing protein YiiM